MLKSMVFIDYLNFKISMERFSSKQGCNNFSVDYKTLALNLNKQLKMRPYLMKTFLFAYRPCDKLLDIQEYKNFYDWLCSLKDDEFFEVVEGTQEFRYIHGKTFNPRNPNTYRVKEKGTDVNISVHMLNKAYHNSYDVAILVSGDSDYIPIVETLHSMAKL